MTESQEIRVEALKAVISVQVARARAGLGQISAKDIVEVSKYYERYIREGSVQR